jgi:molybdopterin biosynthesis enzyme MoaB
VPTAVLSRGLAGVAGRTLVVNLPGSTGGVRDGWQSWTGCWRTPWTS